MTNSNVTENQRSIAYPLDWPAPKYHFGQHTIMGQIMGIEYYAPDYLLAHQYGSGWRYAMLSSKSKEDICYCVESEVELLSPEEVKSKLEAEIDFYQRKMEAIALQLKEVEAVHRHLSAA